MTARPRTRQLRRDPRCDLHPSGGRDRRLVAEADRQIVGHIILSRVFIQTDTASVPTLILAPVSVLPSFQKQRIGGALINAVHKAAIDMGESNVFLLGHLEYYPRFGFKKETYEHRSGTVISYMSANLNELYEYSLENIHKILFKKKSNHIKRYGTKIYRNVKNVFYNVFSLF